MAYKIVEIMGCAGVGKSSVTQHLLEQDHRFQKYMPAGRYRVQYWKYTALRFPQILFFLMMGVRRHYLKKLVRIEAALETISFIKKKMCENVLLIDQGPLSSLAYLYHKEVPGKWVTKWLARLQRKAYGTIDAVFWLDASNRMLVERLNKRANGHKMENMPEAATDQFYDTYRRCYGKVLRNEKYGIFCRQIDTNNLSIPDISTIMKESLEV